MFNVSLFANSAILLFIVLGLGALAGYFCERVGIINIAIDGQMIFGALIFSIFGMIINQYYGELNGFMILVPTIIAVILSVTLSGLFGLLTIKLKVNHVLAGTAINLLLAGIATFLTIPLGEAISNGVIPKLKIEYIPSWKIVDGFFGETILILVISIILIGVSMFVINRTRFGLRFKAIGDNPNAVDAQGVNVNKYKWIGMIVSGMFGAIAGSIFILGGPGMYPQSPYFEGNVAGLGFLAIAIVVSGSWRIPFMTVASLLFAAIMASTRVLSIGDDNVIIEIFGKEIGAWFVKYVLKAIPFVCSLLVLIIFSFKGFAPKALGKNFDKTLR